MGTHSIEVRIGTKEGTTTDDEVEIVVRCARCGTTETMKVILAHLPALASTAQMICADMGLSDPVRCCGDRRRIDRLPEQTRTEDMSNEQLAEALEKSDTH